MVRILKVTHGGMSILKLYYACTALNEISLAYFVCSVNILFILHGSLSKKCSE